MEYWKGIKCRLGACLGAAAEWARLQIAEASNVRPFVCLRAACTVVTLGVLMQANASISYVTTASAIDATDFISWSKMGNGALLFSPAGGTSSNGLSFVAAKPSYGAMRIQSEAASYGGDGELFLNTQDSSHVSIELGQSVSAAGAKVFVSPSSLANVTVRAYNEVGTLIMQTTESATPDAMDAAKYMGVVAGGEQIKKLEYSADFGVISLGRIDLRTSGDQADSMSTSYNGYRYNENSVAKVPKVSNLFFSVLKNSSFVTPSPNVLIGSVNAQSVKLIRGPRHADMFALYPDGSFEYKPAADYHGPDGFAYAGTSDFGQLQSQPARADIDVIWVNSQPTFTAMERVNSDEDAGPQSVEHWATHISAGAKDEDLTQKLTWIVSNTNPSLFDEQPHVTRDGTLKYTAGSHLFGVAKLTVWLQDDGGIDNGGIDTSQAMEVTLAVAPVDHKPTLARFAPQSVYEGSTLEAHAVGSSLDYGRLMTYDLTGAPQGMTVNPLSGLISWTPGEEAAGKTFKVTVRAMSGSDPDSTDSTTMLVSVVPAPLARRHRAIGPGLALAKGLSKQVSSMASIRRVTAIRMTATRRTLAQAAPRKRFWVE